MCGALVAKNRRQQRMSDWQFRRSGYEHKELEMNWDIVAGNWKQFKGKVKAQWGKLTDEQLTVIAGKRAELSGRIQEVYGFTRDKADTQIKRFEKRNRDYQPVIAGKRAELSDKIQEIYGITQEKADAQIRRFEKRNKDYQLSDYPLPNAS
jgi:uncharacterized protein YjbJ (UPF0337 family)